MSENFDTLLSGAPGAAPLRTNGRRTAQRRLLAVTVTSAMLVAVAGAAYAEVPGLIGGMPVGAGSGMHSAAASQYSAIAGVWKPADGAGQYLIVYPDGVVGMGAAGNWSFCAGNAQPATAGQFPLVLAEDDCVAFVDTGFSASSNAAHSILTLTTQSTSGSYTTTYVSAGSSPAGPATGGGKSAGDFTPLVGSWSYGSAGETLTVTASGAVKWTRVEQSGQLTAGTGAAQLLADGTFRITTTFGSPTVSGLWQVGIASGGKSISVLGSYGPVTFTRTAS